MSIDRAVMAFAGFMVLLSLVLSQVHSPYWFLLTAFVGLNLIQASFTRFCPAAVVFKWLGFRPGMAFSSGTRGRPCASAEDGAPKRRHGSRPSSQCSSRRSLA